MCAFVLGTCFVMSFMCPFKFSNHLAEEERVGCFALIISQGHNRYKLKSLAKAKSVPFQ